ncbi:hypothetical protein D3C81_1604040 [compost metagenome]
MSLATGFVPSGPTDGRVEPGIFRSYSGFSTGMTVVRQFQWYGGLGPSSGIIVRSMLMQYSDVLESSVAIRRIPSRMSSFAFSVSTLAVLAMWFVAVLTNADA